jgi:TPP-dependent pyruvate/acetoin dehydrogenase alpha subunit
MVYQPEFLEYLYRTMLRIRLCEESLVDPILRGEIRTPCHLCSGQEAIAVGVCACLGEKDYIFGNHRSHGHFLAKGGDLKAMMAEVYCREGGCSRGRGGSMHLIDAKRGMMGSAPIVAGTISLAVGTALASSIRQDGRVTVSFFGDGATGEGVLYEALNFSALRKLPILFVCENNYYATHMPIRECRVSQEIHKIAEPFLIENHRSDGNDVLEVYERCKKAVEKCRRGEGPIFLEFSTYRLRGHVGPDDNIQGSHTDIRPEAELAEWRRRDPLQNMENYLLENGLVDFDALRKIKDEINEEITEAYLFAKMSLAPNKKELKHYVFRTDPLL